MTVRYHINDGKWSKYFPTDIKANPKYWLKSKEVSEKHPYFEDINIRLQDLKNKIHYAINKFQNKRFTRQQVINYMAGKSDYSTVLSYVDTVMREKKSDQNHKYLRSCVRSFENVLGYTLTFEDLMANSEDIFETYNITWKKRIKSGKAKATSYNTYVKGMGIICKYAYRKKDVYEFVEVPDYYKKIETDEIEIKAFTPEEFEKRIDYVENIYDFKALSVWLLMFSLRGMYQADIVTMREDKVEDGKRNKTARKLTSWWNDEQYIHHQRSKTGVNMLIKLHKKPVLQLLQMVKNVIVFLDYPNENRKNVVASINSKVEIYNYDPLEDERFHSNLWKRTADKLRDKFDGMTFKTARKSYATTMKGITNGETDKSIYSQEDISVQLGQSTKYLLDNHYFNYRDAKLMKIVNSIHLRVLEQFKVQELTEMLADKLKDVIRKENLPKWLMGHSGVHKVGREYKVLVGTADKTKPIWENIEPKYKSYFMADESKSKDFWNDIKEQENEIFGDKLKAKATLQRVFKELKERQKESKALDSLLTESGIDTGGAPS